MEYGELGEKNVVYIRKELGTASVTDDNGKEFHLSLGILVFEGSPYVQCTETGKTFTLSWEDIISLAGKSSILQPWEQE